MTLNNFLLLFVCSFSLAAGAETMSLRAIYLNRQATQLLKDQKPEEALGKWAEALASSPETPEIHLNMGLAFEALGQPEKAIQSFQTADRLAQDQEVQFLSRFNQGAIQQKAKKVDEALAAYHAALEVVPNSRETKINIELLIQDQQQQQKGKGEGESQPQQGNEGQNKDPKESDQKDKKDDQKQGDQKQGDQKKKDDQPKQYAKNKPQPKPFESKEMDPSQAKKILGEILNQEQRIRAEYNKREVKEKPRDKDW